MDQLLYAKKQKQGYVMLVSMIVIGAVATSVVISSLLLGISSSKAAIILQQSQVARMFANACAEMALGEIWLLDAYEGAENINFSEGECSYSVSGSSVPKTISVSGSSGQAVRKIIITVDQLHPYVNASSWQETP